MQTCMHTHTIGSDRTKTDKSEVAQRAIEEGNFPIITIVYKLVRSGHPFNKDHKAVNPSERACTPCSFSHDPLSVEILLEP